MTCRHTYSLIESSRREKIEIMTGRETNQRKGAVIHQLNVCFEPAFICFVSEVVNMNALWMCILETISHLNMQIWIKKNYVKIQSWMFYGEQKMEKHNFFMILLRIYNRMCAAVLKPSAQQVSAHFIMI